MRLGLPYMGSKNKLAERIIALLPRAAHLYDVFAGGCAVTHCALLSRKWQCVHFSDMTDSVELFRDCIEGNIPDGSEWISREDFFARKDAEPYVRLLWSFSNNQREYLYGKDIEAYKKAVHEMIFAPTPNERRLKFKDVCRLMPSVLGLNNGGAENPRHSAFGAMPETAYRVQHLERKLPPPIMSQSVRVLHDLQHNEGFQRLQAISNSTDYNTRSGGGLCHGSPFLGGEYEMRIADYRDIDILPDSVIYCDPPYANTADYGMSFDHEAFYDWAEAQEVPVFISEYWMPEDRFKSIAGWPRTSSFSATNNSLKQIERLYVPNKWYDKYRPAEQKSLFDI